MSSSLFSGDVTLITPLFQSILDLASSHTSTSSNLNISVLIFCTSPLAAVDGGASPNLSRAIELSSPTSSPLIPEERIPTLSFGRRPPLTEILKGVTERTSTGGVVACCCGPLVQAFTFSLPLRSVSLISHYHPFPFKLYPGTCSSLRWAMK